MVGLPVCGCPAVGEGGSPAGFVFPSDGPCIALPRCEGAALAVSREFPWGVETGYFAKAASLDLEHAQEAFERLALRGYVTEVETRVRWYYGSRQAKLWREIPRGDLLVGPVPRYKPADTGDDGVPPQFWWLFWSGPDPWYLRVSKHSWYIASRVLAPRGSMRCLYAETWALEHLPLGALRKLLRGRGYRDTPVGARIESALLSRGGT